MSPGIGLALGGGGARGLAHIGVLKVLDEEKIPISCLSGSSMGGLIAAAYAAGIPPAQIEAEALSFQNIRNLVKLMDLTPHRMGIIGSKHLRNYLKEKLNLDVSFDLLRKRLALTATDFMRGKPVILQDGNVLDAVMATCAFPGIFEPVKLNDNWMVDGGMLNNVPVDVARQLGAEVVIGVEVTPAYPREVELENIENYHPLSPVLPRFTQDFYQTALIMIAVLTRNCLENNRPDILLRPEMAEDLSIFFGFPRAAEAISAGEQATRQIIPQLHHLLDDVHN